MSTQYINNHWLKKLVKNIVLKMNNIELVSLGNDDVVFYIVDCETHRSVVRVDFKSRIVVFNFTVVRDDGGVISSISKKIGIGQFNDAFIKECVDMIEL